MTLLEILLLCRTVLRMTSRLDSRCMDSTVLKLEVNDGNPAIRIKSPFLLHESIEVSGWERGYRARFCQLLPEIWRKTGNISGYSLEFAIGSP